MALRLLGYMVRIWDRYSITHPSAPLPLIIPALLAHAAGGWTAPTRFSELFCAYRGSFGDASIPDFTFSVDDLADVSDDGLRARALDTIPKVALWLMRDARDATALLGSLQAWLPVLDNIVRAPTGQQTAAGLLRYLALVSDDLRFEQFRDKLKALAPATEALAMTIAEQLRAEGEARGKAEGEARGRAEGHARALLSVLKAREFRVSDEVQTRVLRCTDVQLLDRWVSRATTVDRPEDIFKD